MERREGMEGRCESGGVHGAALIRWFLRADDVRELGVNGRCESGGVNME